MESNIFLIPDYQIFEACFLSGNSGDYENPAFQFFKKAWTHRVDFREKVVCISQELNNELIEKRYKSEKKKKQALFSVVRIHPIEFGCNSSNAQIKLASLLSIEEDREVYYVTDNPNLARSINENGIKTLNSAGAIKVLEDEIKMFIEQIPDPTGEMPSSSS